MWCWCIDMCIDTFTDMCADTCAVVRIDMLTDMCSNSCADVYRVCCPTPAVICLFSSSRLAFNVRRHVCRHVYRHMCRHVRRPVPRASEMWATQGLRIHILQAVVALGSHGAAMSRSDVHEHSSRRAAERCSRASQHIGSISASPTACLLCGYGRAGTQNDRLAEAVVLSTRTSIPIPAQ